MGMVMSFMGKGLMAALYQDFNIQKDISNFEDFHKAILVIFNNFNSALPGKHYVGPSHEKVKEFFKEWKDTEKKDKDNARKKVFEDFMKKNIKLSKPDAITLITGIVTPPAAMAAKRAGENVPQLKMIKVVPDVIFVPSLKVLALVTAKLSRTILGNTTS